MRWFMQAFSKGGKFSLNLVAKSVAVVMRGIGRLTGGGFLEQVAEFITDLNDLFGGFKERAREVAKAFRSDDFAYVLVTTPAPVAVREALFFADRLIEQGMRRDAIVVNRVHRKPRAHPTLAEIRTSVDRHRLELADRGAERLEQALHEELLHADLDAKHLAELARAIVPDAYGRTPVRVEIPALPSDVHDLGTLAGVAALLCPPMRAA
jgi:anion-transporting  ArsA/GET3 family ATPase